MEKLNYNFRQNYWKTQLLEVVSKEAIFFFIRSNVKNILSSFVYVMPEHLRFTLLAAVRLLVTVINHAVC